MRQQAIEKLSLMICDEVRYGKNSNKLDNLCVKMRILLDRSNNEKASSVIREVMNS